MEIAQEMQPARWPMTGVHIGLAIVAVGAVYTLQPPGAFGTRELISFGVVGLALIGFGIIRWGRGTGAAGRGVLAFGAAIALYLAWDPQLASLPGLAGIGGGPLGGLEPSLAHIGAVMAAIFLALQMAVDRRAMPTEVAFRGALLAAALLVIALGVIMWLALRGLYDLSGTSGIALLSFRTVAYTLLMLVCLTASGMRRVGTLAHIYMGLALVAAVARNMMG